MMEEAKISVAMATYNGALYLREQLDSFVAQTRRPDELIVTDDGSTDNTLGILEAFQATAPFEVKVYRNSVRLGYTKNFEKALSFCSCDVIFISDQDDVWFPEKIERLSSRLSREPRIMVISNDEIVTDQKLCHEGTGVVQGLRAAGATVLPSPGCCTAIRRVWRDLVLPFPEVSMSYDFWITMLAERLGVRLVLLEPLQLSRRHGSNASRLSSAPPRKTGFFENLRTLGLRDSRPGWLSDACYKRLFREWLERRTEQLRPFGLEDAREAACRRLELEIQVLEKRILLMGQPRGLRLPAVARLLMEGGYTHLSGWKSAINDVLR